MPEPVDNTTQQQWPPLFILSLLLSPLAALAIYRVWATQGRFPNHSSAALPKLRVLAICWLRCRTGLTSSLFFAFSLFFLSFFFKRRLSSSACSTVDLAATSRPVAASTPSPEVPDVIAESLHNVCFLQQQKEKQHLRSWTPSHLRLDCVPPTQETWS